MSCLGISRSPPFNTIRDEINLQLGGLPQFPKKCAIRPFSFDSFYIICKAKVEASVMRLPALGSYISVGNSFQTNMELNMAVHRGCSVNSSLTKEKEFTSLSSLPYWTVSGQLRFTTILESHFLRLQQITAHYL